MPPNIVQPPPIQRAILSRHHHSRRSASSIAPKLEPGVASLPPPIHGFQHSTTSPKTRPTPPGASPTNSTPTFSSGQSLASPTAPNHTTMPTAIPPHMKPQMPPMPGMAPPGRQPMPQPPRPPGSRDHGFYPTQSFQSHIEQLGKLTRSFPLLIELWRPRFNP